MDDWGWEHLNRWIARRLELPLGPLFCVIIDGPTRGRPWPQAGVRSQLRRLACQAGVRRRSHHTSCATLTPSRWPARASRST
jgi:hypothetical protein